MSDARHQIMSDGRTVWVSDDRGTCIGRFSRFGIDIHRTLEAQARGEPQCLTCTHTKPTVEDWRDFQALMRQFYGVMVSDRHQPQFLAPLKQAEMKDVEDANLP